MPSVAAGNAEEEMVSGFAAGAAMATASDMAADAVWRGELPSVAVAVKLNVPLAVGMPETTPVLDWRVIPLGRLPEVTDHI